jgi:hypothetical protein
MQCVLKYTLLCALVLFFYLLCQRPYTALVVYENLHQKIKKPALIRILDELSEEGHLQQKDFKKVRVYLAKQVSQTDRQRDEE